jgi:hypothetical protein
LNLTINASPLASAVDNGDASITASTGSSYQWINCATGLAITGETSQTYTPTVNGSYQVAITNASGCSDTSSCVNINNVSIKEIDGSAFVFSVSPNPSNGNFNIQSSMDLEIEIYNSVGQIVLKHKIVAGENDLQLKNIDPGMYMIHGKDAAGNQFNERLIIAY